MKKFYKLLLSMLNSWLSKFSVVIFCLVNFYLGQAKDDMNLFAASGAVMTIFGLLSMIKFTTIEKYLNQDAIIAANTGVTGGPMGPEEAAEYQKKFQAAARVRVKKELHSEISGLIFTVLGTLIWAYGSYVPILKVIAGNA